MDRHLMLSKIAWMEVRGELSHPQLEPFKRDLFNFLKKAGEFEKNFFLLERKIQKGFDRYMKKNGLARMNTPEYKSLRGAIAEAVITSDGRVWEYSFDTYLPVLSSYSPPPGINGKRAFEDIRKMFKRDVERLYNDARGLLREGRVLLKKGRFWYKDSLRTPWERITIEKVEVPQVGRKRKVIVKKVDYLTAMKRSMRRMPFRAYLLKARGEKR